MSQTLAIPTAPATLFGRRALFLLIGAVAGIILAAVFLLAIGAAVTTAPQAGPAVAAIVLATYAGGGVLVGAVLADVTSDPIG